MDGESRAVKTRLTSSPAVAAAILRSGGLAAFPTETVYGLGANAMDAGAVEKIFKAKGRPSDNPLIVHVGSLDQIRCVAHRIPVSARRLMHHFFPGPLTLVVPRHPDVPRVVSAGLDTVGVRFPAHPVAARFLRACKMPVAAPSANRSGRPSPTTWSAVRDELGGRVDCILKGGPSAVGLESTVVDCTGRVPVILREGAVTLEDLQRVVPSIRAAQPGRGGGKKPVRSPGMKYRHYAPAARVILVDGPAEIKGARSKRAAYIGLTTRGLPETLARTMRCPSLAHYARSLFQFFRICEADGIRVIYCQRVALQGLGRALMDRLRKAAAARPTAS